MGHGANVGSQRIEPGHHWHHSGHFRMGVALFDLASGRRVLIGRRTDYFPSAQASAGRVVIGIILFWKPGQILPDQHLISILNLLHLTECHIFKGQLQTFASQPGYLSIEILNRIRNGLGHG